MTVPTSVTVAAGSSIANFAATAGNISVAGSATITATFNNTTQSATIQLSAPITPAITIQTSPSGLQFSVDGGPQQTAPQTLSLSQGQHTIAVLTIQPGATGTQYLFTSWSDGGAASHTITVGTSAATYTATFKTQYRLTTSASPSAGGTVTPSSGGFYDANTVVQVNATPNSGYTFSGWTGSVASPSSTSTTVTMSAPQSVTGNFAPITSTPITIQTSPSGLLFTLDGGTPQAAPQIVSLSPGQHTIAVATTQTGGTGTQYLFTSWSDGLAASHTITVGSFAATYTATFKTQYQLTISASPVSGGTVTPASGAYYDAGTIVPVSATPNSGFIFSSWTGPVANAGVASTTVTMTSPQTVRANFTTAAPTCTFTLSASSATVGPTAPSGSVDVTTSPTCSFTASAAAGSFATVTNGPNYTGSSTVTYSIQPNSGGTRSTTLTIANQTFTINQLTGCVLGLSPTSASFPAALSGGSQTAAFSVGSTSSTCGFTATSSNTSFLTVASSNGSPTVFYTIFSNSSTAGRTATITVTGQGGAAGQTQVFTVIQGGATPCTFALAQSGQAFLAAGGTGTASVLAPAGCAWSTTNNSSFVSISGGGSGNGTVSYTVQSNPNTTSRVGSLTIAGLPYAVTQAGASPLSCSASVPSAPQVALEGRTEVLGDLILTCTGLTSPLTANIALTLNTDVTNAITSGFSDAIAQVNGVATTNGAVAGYSTLNFSGVSLTPNGGTATVRISNVRADASLLGSAATLQSMPVNATVAVNASVSVPVTNPSQTLAYAAQSLVFQQGTATASGSLITIPVQFQEASIGAFHADGTPTRLRLVLSNVPANVTVSAPLFNSDPVTRAQLISLNPDGSGGSPFSGSPGATIPLIPTSGAVTATWVVTSSDPNAFETDTFPLILQNATAQDVSQMQISASLAPVSTVSIASPVGSAPVPRFRDFSTPQKLVNLRSTSTVLTTPGSSSLIGHALAASRLNPNSAGGTGSFGNGTNNDDQDNPSMGTMAQTTVTGGKITDCEIQPPATGSCNMSSDGSSATAMLGQLDPGKSVTYVISVQPNPCQAATCAVQEDVSVSSTSPNADVKTSHSSSVFIVNGCTPGQPGSLTATGGSNQSAPVSTAFAAPLQVTLTDSCGSPVAGQTIAYQAPSGGASASLSSATAITNSNGVASVTATANGTAGAYTVTASSGGLSATFSLTNTSGGGTVTSGPSQSSTYPGSPLANVAMDGNTDGNYFDGSVTATNFEPNPWWQVNLGSSQAISSVVIWNRTDCCGSRLGDYWVFVSNTPFLSSDTPSTLANRAGTFASHQTMAPSPSATIPVGTTGQYVRVQLSGTDYLSLAEVQVNTGPGTPLSGASQSSTYPGSPSASVAMDGNTDGNYFDGSVTATNLESNPWWQEDLGVSRTIGSVVIWNRTDCCSSRLSDYWVFVSNTPFLPTDTPSTLANRPATFASHQTASPNPSTTITVGLTGQYVRVQLSSPNILSLAEVQVTTGGITNGNLAQGKAATQSSTLPGAPPASVAVDGNVDGNFFDGSVTATNPDPFPWWQVDLGASTTITSIVIWNRTDCCSERLNNYWIFVSDTPFLPTDTPATLQSRGGTFNSYQAASPNPSSVIPVIARGRYVRIQLGNGGYLSLAEVQVYGGTGSSGSRIATQSSTYPGSPPASAAIDGNTDGNFNDGSVTATNLENSPWWEVDLGTTSAINTLTIWNRTDCCGSRLGDYWVFVSNTPFADSDTPAALASRSGILASHQISAPSPSTVISVGIPGRYIRVQLTGTNYLSLAEVQVQ
ncbi:MAG TPA: discoidin domain-containing protein [Bryobacteraceae bacterium]|nr:discoidin domain-containing protein [Bryobacteraceae bacterium]